MLLIANNDEQLAPKFYFWKIFIFEGLNLISHLLKNQRLYHWIKFPHKIFIFRINIMPKKLTWYCPCNCKTPKGLHEKFYVITTLFTHINDSHSKELDIMFLYRVKPSPDSIVNVEKKKKHWRWWRRFLRINACRRGRYWEWYWCINWNYIKSKNWKINLN